MARYPSEDDARLDGITIEHRPDEHIFYVLQEGKTIGFARYKIRSDESIDFNGTVIDPEYRGTGLSRLLAARAVGDSVVKGRTVRASCWFIARHLENHPDDLAEGATYGG